MPQETLDEKMQKIRRQQEEAAAQRQAEKHGIPYANLARYPIDVEALSLVDQVISQKAELAVVQQQGRNLIVALLDPDNNDSEKILQDLEKRNFKCQKVLVSMSSLIRAWSFYGAKITAKPVTGQVAISSDTINKYKKELGDLKQIKQKIKEASASQVSEIVELILAAGLKIDASDIHIEPKNDQVVLRYRVDGILYDSGTFPTNKYRAILSRVKLLSGLKLNIQDKPQDGRFSIEIMPQAIEIRTSVLPGPNGEAVVLRILNPKTVSLGMEQLGMRPDELLVLEKQLQQTTGLVLTTGPTGSGKTTTLYACIKKIATPEIKVITIEDPVEYHLSGIEQTQIKPEEGYDFASALRSVMRHDPDVILVGEIRDRDTAGIAINASLTGHLVLSTVHTNDAAGAVPRMIDLGASMTNLPAALDLVMAQRLVRRLCPECTTKMKLGDARCAIIKKGLRGLDLNKLKLDKFSADTQVRQPNPQGCSTCNFTGFKGRVAVFELFLVDEEIEKLISQNPTHSEMLAVAREKGMTTMAQSGLIKVLQGVTTIEEIERVLGAI